MPSIEEKLNYIKICDSIINIQTEKMCELEERKSMYQSQSMQSRSRREEIESQIYAEKRKKDKYEKIKNYILEDLIKNSSFKTYVNGLGIEL